MWIGLPFFVDLRPIDDSDLVKNYFIEMRTMQMIKDKINSKSLKEFCCSLVQAYPRLEKRSMAALTLFATTYLCEQGGARVWCCGTAAPPVHLIDDIRYK